MILIKLFKNLKQAVQFFKYLGEVKKNLENFDFEATEYLTLY